MRSHVTLISLHSGEMSVGTADEVAAAGLQYWYTDLHLHLFRQRQRGKSQPLIQHAVPIVSADAYLMHGTFPKRNHGGFRTFDDR